MNIMEDGPSLIWGVVCILLLDQLACGAALALGLCCQGWAGLDRHFCGLVRHFQLPV